jgi:hypothetical protein
MSKNSKGSYIKAYKWVFYSNVLSFHYIVWDEINIEKYYKIHDITKPWIQD